MARQRRLFNSQLSNFKTYKMYERQLLTLAKNVYLIKNLSPYVDLSYINSVLVTKGSIAWFIDDELEDSPTLLALPYSVLGKLDIYGRPQNIIVQAQNGYTRRLSRDQFVIMYDNNGKYSLLSDIVQYSERMALCQRAIDINIAMQKTPRFWKTKSGQERTVQDIIDNVDGNIETVLTYKDFDLDDTTLILSPAPFVSDKVETEKDKIFNEFLRLIGVANLQYQKKERNITDEIKAMQGGTIASRFSRFEPRQRAIEEIKQKFGIELELSYYDGIPTTIQELEENNEEEDETNV